MTPEMHQVVKEQLATFVAKFGREPDPNDPLFFDPDESVPTPMNEDKVRAELARAMEAANIPEHKRQQILKNWDNNDPIFGKPRRR